MNHRASLLQVSLGRPNCSNLEIEGAKRRVKGTWQGPGVWKHCIEKFQSTECTTRPRKTLDIHSSYLKWKTYFCYFRFTASLVKATLTILLVLSSWVKEPCRKILHSKKMANCGYGATCSNKKNIIITRAVNNQH